MPNDAKLGLVVGVGLVIAVAVMFFRKDAGAPDASSEAAASAAGASSSRPKQAKPANGQRPVKAKPTAAHHHAKDDSSDESTDIDAEESASGDASQLPLPTPNVLQPVAGLEVPELRPSPPAPGK